MATTDARLTIISSPHIRTTESIPKIMWTVNAVLAPVGIFAIYWFGWRAALTLALCIGAAVVSEVLCQKFRGMKVTVSDGSAFLTGMLFAYVMPASQPWYVSIFGAAFAIAIAKHTFGGLGNNIWNPALVARAAVLLAWPAATILGTSWPLPAEDATPGLYDLNSEAAMTAPSVLSDPEVMTVEAWPAAIDAQLREATGLPPTASRGDCYLRMLWGTQNGCLGETAGLLLILGGLFLMWRGLVNWRVPFFFILSALLVAFILPEKIRLAGGAIGWSDWFSGDVLRQLLGGGLLIGAFFMATDMVTSPVTNKGAILFAVGCGVLTAVIRLVGGYPEGVSYSIILMNTAVPLIDRHTRPRTFGEADE